MSNVSLPLLLVLQYVTVLVIKYLLSCRLSLVTASNDLKNALFPLH